MSVGVECSEGDPDVVGSDVLLAVGRRPNTDALDLVKAGVATDPRGYIEVDDGLATNVPGIWALGDCNGRGAFKRSIPDGGLLRRGADGLGRMRGINRQSALVAEIRELADEIEAVQAA